MLRTSLPAAKDDLGGPVPGRGGAVLIGSSAVAAQGCREVGDGVPVEREDGLGDAVGSILRDRERGRSHELRHDCVEVERPLAGAAIDPDMAEELAAVLQRDPNSAGEVRRKGGARVDRAAHPARERAHRRIGDRIGLQLGQAEPALQEAGRDDVLRRELRLVVGAGRSFAAAGSATIGIVSFGRKASASEISPSASRAWSSIAASAQPWMKWHTG